MDEEREYGEGKYKKTLQTFILGNEQTKRIRCLIWGDNRIKELRKKNNCRKKCKYSSNFFTKKPFCLNITTLFPKFFILFQIIQILRGDAKPPNMKFFPTNDKNLLKVELQILKDTEVNLFGVFDPKRKKKNVLSTVNFKTITEAEGDVGMSGTNFICFFDFRFSFHAMFVFLSNRRICETTVRRIFCGQDDMHHRDLN